ncbi:MAG: AI-2E family transporter [Bacteroidota bacterium]|nr:AI-2E family transporter [Bacteroidota bacterium]MDP4234254.1 AI-2E family transporter [Bacteroidota bacterium]MDP4243444.1 AI-2E family transporter [Bacteroidota bacterium]MDP4288143.1 AI-2E family transporter [Bacteroidota bacterium]
MRTFESFRRFDGIALALGGMALIALAFFVQSVLSPFVTVAILFLLMFPFREYRAARRLMVAGGALFAVWFFFSLSGLLVPFILGGLLAYLFNPIVTRLHESRKIPRAWSSIVFVLLFCAVLVTVGWIFIPSLIVQTREFITRLTFFVREHSDSFDLPHLRRVMLTMGLPEQLVDRVLLEQVGPEVRKAVAIVPRIIFDLITGLPRFLERTLNLIIVPIAMFYFLKDWPKLRPLLFELFPVKNPARRDAIIADMDRVLYGFIRGQATVAIIIGALGAIAYSILGIPYAGLLGVVLAVAELVPIVGMIFSLFVVELVIFLTMVLNFGVIASGILVIMGLHFLEAYFIGPRIIGEGIGIPPILMILALTVFGYFLGLLGLLIAVPTTGIILLFVNEYRRMQKVT